MHFLLETLEVWRWLVYDGYVGLYRSGGWFWMVMFICNNSNSDTYSTFKTIVNVLAYIAVVVDWDLIFSELIGETPNNFYVFLVFHWIIESP